MREVRPERFAALSSLDVDVGRRGTIRAQLLGQLRAAILDLRLPAGARLPSTRAVASRLGISRSTVTDVFDQLLAEGYLVARHGSGTYVSPAVRSTAPRARISAPSTSWERVSRRGKLFADITTRTRYGDKEPRAFQTGVPAIELFPFGTWSRIAGALLRNPPRELVSYGDPAGYRALREAIAAQFRDRKHVACDAEQVIVTSGTQQSLDIINRLMLDPEEQVWIEDPGSLAARATFAGAGARLVPVPVDDEGLIVAHGVAAAPFARLAFVTPAVQSPTTVTMSAPRRAELLAWADRADAWIVEDDYEDIFRYDGLDPSPLLGAPSDRVILIGSFSLSTFPALRIGYIIAPRPLVDAFVAAKGAIDRQGATVDQAVLAEFVLDGHHIRHLRRMSAEYAERRAALADCIAQYLPHLAFAPPQAGLHVLLRLDGRDDEVLARAASRHGVSVTPLSPLYLDRERPRGNGLLLGFAVASPGEIRLGMRKLRDAFLDVRGRTLAARQ